MPTRHAGPNPGRRPATAAALIAAALALAALPAIAPADDRPTGDPADKAKRAGVAESDTPLAAAAARRRKVVRVADNFFSPSRTRVRRRTLVVWRWSRRNSQTHDVLLARAPRGVRRFRSAAATTGYRFKRRLRKPGRYLVICTFHADMKMRIRVRR